MCKPSLLHVFVVIMACTSILATTPAAAHMLGDLLLPDVRQCLAGVFEVHGCLQELIFSALTLQPPFLGPTCCSAFLRIDEGCLPKVFPLDPTFPTLLQTYCFSIQDSPRTPPPPPPPPPPSQSPPDPPPSPCEPPYYVWVGDGCNYND